MEVRKAERSDWTRAGQNRGTSKDLKAVSEALSYLRQKGLSTVEDLEAFLEALSLIHICKGVMKLWQFSAWSETRAIPL